MVMQDLNTAVADMLIRVLVDLLPAGKGRCGDDNTLLLVLSVKGTSGNCDAAGGVDGVVVASLHPPLQKDLHARNKGTAECWCWADDVIMMMVTVMETMETIWAMMAGMMTKVSTGQWW